ncbi:hypothetical protein [Roseinatronobacter alkalisoli]|uniref:Uncharacterized protein n=1 Tax=Roseinatronobacter alkalisoli TaxID=3028235 RepID=A0ABT5TBV1_9RHOB|nr:hypothetical protein [Roseinatronobacter sp. HJB301]MDD7971403.1 hypothetical protein [Roseinatronobacter sp. HJB301]
MKKRATLSISMAVIFALAVTYFYAAPRIDDATAQTSDRLGDCSPQRWAEYVDISADAAPIRFGGTSLDFGPGAYERFRQAFAALTLTQDTTYLVAVDIETGELFPVPCDDELCTSHEANEPDMTCLKDGHSGCTTIALVFKNEAFCLAYPRN